MNKMKNTILILVSVLLLASCSTDRYEKTQNGVIVKVKQNNKDEVQLVRLQVVNDKIIHVTATPEDRFSTNKSLITVPQKQDTKFTVSETEKDVKITTSEITAAVSLTTGEIVFTDKTGKVILNEDNGGKTFKAIEVEGTKGYEIRQVFQSPNDEAFYGLGQHQADEFNYKGRNEELFQYNTKVSVPFVISNKNYGILWDNYSLSRFGDSRGYANLDEAFKLVDKTGKAGGLTGTYIPSPRTNLKTIVRTEPNIYFEDLKTIKNLPKDFPLMGSNVTYEGTFEPQESGLFHFYLYYAGYMKVYINNELVVPERWRTAWNPNGYKFALELKKGTTIPLKIEWEPDGGDSYCGLRVLTPIAPEEQNKLAIFSEMGDEIDYYFIAGNNMDEVISGYRTITGKAPIMPKWAMGYWQSRERYKTQDEVVGTLREFRERQIPIDNIVQDWSYWPENAWGSHEFDLNRFPNPKKMVDDIHSMNAHLMISVWPKFYRTTEHFKEFDERGWMYQQAIKDSIRDWIGPGYVGSFYDAYSEGAQKLFWQQLKDHLYHLGIDAWWMDASEPNVRDCTDMDYRKALCGPTALGPSTKYFNAYSLMNAKAIYEGLREEDPDTRVFQLTRSGFSGLQRYSTATWSGDIATRWEDMKAQISAGLNFAMSGIPYWTMDIGGFCVESRYVSGYQEFIKTGRENPDHKEWRELNTRWYQFGAFSPLFRSHGQFPYREPWHIAPEGHPAYESLLYYTKLRYNMMPYIYSLAGMTYFDDYTIMRALVMDFGYDTKVNNIGDQFLLGPSVMACPVYEYNARNREVYFPANSGWYDFYSGKFIEGGKALTVDAPYERIPLYVRAGAIIPYGEDMQYTNEKPDELITLYVYAGADGQFTLYEDESTNYNYEKGAYSTIPFTYNDQTRTLTIGERKGEFPGMLNQRKFNVVVVDKSNSQGFDMKAKGQMVDYNGSLQTVKL